MWLTFSPRGERSMAQGPSFFDEGHICAPLLFELFLLSFGRVLVTLL